MLLIFLWRAPKPELVIAIAEWLCLMRTAPHCDRGSLCMANQVATGAGNAFAYGTGAGGSLRMANQVVTGAGFAREAACAWPTRW